MVHAVHVGITLSLMCHTTLTKLNLVNLVKLSPILSRAFSIYNTRVKHSSLNLWGLDQREGGNRYQSYMFIQKSPSKTRFNGVFTMFPLCSIPCSTFFLVSH